MVVPNFWLPEQSREKEVLNPSPAVATMSKVVMQRLLEILPQDSEDFTFSRAMAPARAQAKYAVIMDGTGRWAKLRGLPPAAGHKAGVPAIRTTVETCAQMAVKVLTLYAFSAENWKRPRAEVDTLWQLLRI